MPTSRIAFDPEIDERQLDREVDKVNSAVADAASDVETRIDAEVSDVDLPGGVGGAGGGGGDGAGTATSAAGVGALAKKIPKPVAGVTAGAALPIALAGGVGLGMLSAMQSASARLQTSNQLFGVAVDNFFREPGDILDENIVRPLAESLLDVSTDFDEALRQDDIIGAVDAFPAIVRSSLLPALGPLALLPEIRDSTRLIRNIPGDLRRALPTDLSLPEFSWPTLPEFSWPEPPAWPEIPDPPDWSDLSPGVPDWTTLAPPLPDWSDLNPFSGNDGDTDTGTDTPRDTGGTDEPTGPGGGVGDIAPSVQTGGRITGSGVAEVHRGELVTDEERLVSELADAVARTTDSGGGGGGSDRLESKLDTLHRDLQQLRRAMDVTLEVGKDELGRASEDARRNYVSDTDPLS